jgi:hypothetical protein
MTPVEFIDALLRHFAKRHRSEDESAQWMREMVQSVTGTDSRVLATAYVLILDEHDERAFPLPAQIKAWLVRAAEKVYPEHQASLNKAANADWQQRAEQAERMMVGKPITREAIEQGWVLGLREHVAATGQFPMPNQIHRIRQNMEFVARAAAGTVQLGVVHDQLVNLAGRMIERQNRIADRIIAEWR